MSKEQTSTVCGRDSVSPLIRVTAPKDRGRKTCGRSELLVRLRPQEAEATRRVFDFLASSVRSPGRFKGETFFFSRGKAEVEIGDDLGHNHPWARVVGPRGIAVVHMPPGG